MAGPGRKVSGLPLQGAALGDPPQGQPPPKSPLLPQQAVSKAQAQAPGCHSAAAGSRAAPQERGPAAGGGHGGGGTGLMRHQPLLLGPAASEGGTRPGTREVEWSPARWQGKGLPGGGPRGLWEARPRAAGRASTRRAPSRLPGASRTPPWASTLTSRPVPQPSVSIQPRQPSSPQIQAGRSRAL